MVIAELNPSRTYDGDGPGDPGDADGGRQSELILCIGAACEFRDSFILEVNSITVVVNSCSRAHTHIYSLAIQTLWSAHTTR